MAHARFLAAVLTSSLAGATLLAAITLGAREAFAAAGPSIRPTAARTARARRSSDPQNAVRRAGEAPRDGASASSKDAPARERGGAQEKNGVRGAEHSAKSAPESASTTKSAPSDTRLAPPPEVGKTPLYRVPSRSGDGTPNRSADAAPRRNADATRAADATGARSAEAAATRNADARAVAAKMPGETAASQKGSAPLEKASAETSLPDAAEPARAALDSVAPSAKRDITSATSASSANAPSTRFIVVALEGPVFDGGDVPRAAAALERMKAAFSRCASVENALTKAEASIDLRFLVRAPGRAEGVDVDKARGVSSDVVRCMTSVLARSYIGAPSDDPVGVAITVRVRRSEAASN